MCHFFPNHLGLGLAVYTLLRMVYMRGDHMSKDLAALLKLNAQTEKVGFPESKIGLEVRQHTFCDV